MGLETLMQLPKRTWQAFAEALTGWLSGPQKQVQPAYVRRRGGLDLSRDTSRHRVHAARYEDLLK